MASVFNLRRTMIGAGEEAEQARATRGGAHVLQDMGTILRERREAMGISLAEAEAATRIRQKYVSALENNEWAVLPGEVVGRGFLRNYSSYLGLDTTEMMERRRAAADPRLAASLVNISVGATLPPERAIDYRPMNVDIKDEPDAIQGRNLRLRPILTGLGVLAVTLLLLWGVVNFGDDLARGVAGLPARLAEAVASAQEAAPLQEPSVTPIVPAAGDVNTARSAGPLANLPPSSDVQANSERSDVGEAAQAAVDAERSADTAAAEPGGDGSGDDAANGDAGGSDPAAVAVEDTGEDAGGEETAVDGETAAEDTNGGDGAEGEETAVDGETAAGETDAAEGLPTESPGEQAAEPAATPTFTALPPTATFTPDPPTATPEPPTPEPAPVVAAAPAAAAACADPGTQIFSPGVNQAVAGTVEITGVATSPIFQEYKLEWAPAGTGSFNWFTGASVPVESDVLGYFDSAAVPPQAIDLRLTVVDNTGNFQTPCTVTINVQN